MLKIMGLSKNFGGVTAVNNLDLVVNQGEISGLIGPNGAGKTTVFNLITGFLRPTRGKIWFENSEITGKSTHSITDRGIGRTFQLTAYLPEMTLLQNVLISCHLHPRVGFWEAIFNTSSCCRKEQDAVDSAMKTLQFLGLKALKDELAQNLSYGYQRLLGMAMALSTKPKLLLLDEPLGGMNAQEVHETVAFIRKIRDTGITVLLVEHNMRAVMELCDRIFVINFGRKIAEGIPSEIKINNKVIEAYLGVKRDVPQP